MHPMKNCRIISWLFVIGSITLIVAVSILLVSKLTAKSPQPRIRFEEETWNFGTLSAGEKATHVFKFRNAGDAELEISRIEAPCTCTTALLSTEKLKPGAEGELRVDFKETEERGDLQRIIKVYSNDRVNPVKVLTIEAFLMEPYKVNPPRLYFDTNGSAVLELSSPDEGNLQINKVETSSEYLSAAVSSSKKVDGQLLFQIKVNLSVPPTIHGSHEQVIIHTNKEAYPEIRVPVHIRMEENIRIQPNKLFFGIISSGEAAVQQAVISIPKGSPLHIERIECKSKAILAELVKEKNTIAVKLKQDAPLGRFQDAVKIHTTDPNSPLLELAVYGVVLPVKKAH